MWKARAFTFIEMIISLFIFALVIFMFSQIPTLVQDSDRSVFKVSSETKTNQAIWQLEHYFQKCIFKGIEEVSKAQRLKIQHADQMGVYQDRIIKVVNGSLRLQNDSNKGNMPLIDGVDHVTFKRVGPYIDMKLTLENMGQPIHHRFYCPASKGG